MIVSASARPITSPRDQPKVASAARFQPMINPAASIAMNASWAPSRIAWKSRSIAAGSGRLSVARLPIAFVVCAVAHPFPPVAPQPFEQGVHFAAERDRVERLAEVGDRAELEPEAQVHLLGTCAEKGERNRRRLLVG